ncbi:hypothetical protein DPMN_061534 [Dreissena polymorpha]|uniref:Uncharacterized protein n=1 Tax=Dreissena polymorpha TaxID=45954 RepID=A0A9D4HIJ0_DREPO|nr:hypothetical protein DPMN_061534 [Dreissena polymorpha]
MNRESPVRTRNNQLGTAWDQRGLHRDQSGLHCQSAGLLMYRSYSGTLSAFTRLPVALQGSIWAPLELRCCHGCSRCSLGCSQCHAGRLGSSP